MVGAEGKRREKRQENGNIFVPASIVSDNLVMEVVFPGILIIPSISVPNQQINNQIEKSTWASLPSLSFFFSPSFSCFFSPFIFFIF